MNTLIFVVSFIYGIIMVLLGVILAILVSKPKKNKELIFTKTTKVKSPVRGHETDAGIDFFIPDDFKKTTIKPGEDVLIDAGIKVVVPKGYALIFKEKSGVATKKKLTIGASVVDSDYRGNVHIHLFNNGTKSQTIEPGDKITQAVIFPVSLCTPTEIDTLDYATYEVTERGSGGFGSTGSK